MEWAEALLGQTQQWQPLETARQRCVQVPKDHCSQTGWTGKAPKRLRESAVVDSHSMTSRKEGERRLRNGGSDVTRGATRYKQVSRRTSDTGERPEAGVAGMSGSRGVRAA